MTGFGSLLTGHTLVTRYRIGPVIGRGGFAVVYDAHDERLDRAVAVKVITLTGPEGSLEEEVRARFQREARASAGLQHRNVVGIFDFGTDPTLGLDFLVMERLRGEDLRTRLRRPDPIRFSEAMHVLTSAAAGIADGHLAGIIHRDVKPANIFLTESKEIKHYRVCVLDFGIALLAAADETTRLTGSRFPLSVPYASPEQLAGRKELTPASDVFSLGVVAYELLSRRRPFSSSADRARALEERRTDPAPLRDLNPHVPAPLAAAIHQALSFEAAERFPDAQAFARAMEAPHWTAPVAAPATAPDVTQVAPRSASPASPRRTVRVAALAGLLITVAAAGAVVFAGNDGEDEAPQAARLEKQLVDSVEPSPGERVESAETSPPEPVSLGAGTAVAAPSSATPRAAAPVRTSAPPERPTPTRASPEPRTSAPEPPTRATRTAPPRTSSASLPAVGASEFRENLPHRCHSLPTDAASACLREDLAAADRDLNVVYRRVMSQLPTERREALRASQRAWLARYDAVITSYYSTPWGDHSRIKVLPSQIQALRDRTAYLRRVSSGG